MLAQLVKRQCSEVDEYGDCVDSFWYTSTGLAIRYAVVAALFVLFLIFFVGAYLHAQRRMKRGLPPLAYHRWLLRRNPRYYPTQQPYYPGMPQQQQQGYPMQNFQYAPPAYNNWDAPPQYQPPEGGSKVLPNQNIGSPDMNRAGESSGGVRYPEASHAGVQREQ